MSNKIKVKGKDVATAIANGLVELGLRRDQVDVHVVENPSKGFLGFGSKPAIVELQQKRWSSGNLDSQIYMDVPKKKRPSEAKPKSASRGVKAPKKEERTERTERAERPARGERRGGRKPFAKPAAGRAPARDKAPKENEAQLLPCERIVNTVIPQHLEAPLAEAKNYLEQVVGHMGVKVENLNAWWDDKQQRILLTFDCDHPAIVIGKEGKTLESIQYLATLAVSRHFDKPISVITDTQNYWRKAEDKIDAELERGVAMIKSGNSVFRFRPMSAQLRRYIHRAIENNEFVVTSSEGEGKWRKVTLRPRPADQPVGSKRHTVCACDCTPVAPVKVEETFTECECEAAVPPVQEQECDCSRCDCGCHSEPDTLQTVCELAAAAELTAAQMQQSQQILDQVNNLVEKHLQEPEEVAPAAVLHTTVETVTDDACGGTCQAEIARNCQEGETAVGCACSQDFVEPQAAATQAPVPTMETVTPEHPGETCQAELARNCADIQTSTGCACGPLFDAQEQPQEVQAPAEEIK